MILYLRSHVTLSSYSMVQRNINSVDCCVIAHSKSQITDSARPIRFHQYVFRLQIAMGDCRFAYDDN